MPCAHCLHCIALTSVVTPSCHRRNVNPDELDDGYHAVGAPSAARQLQASGRVPEATYAQVDMSQKTNRPVPDVYAQVDKKKKSKKKQKKV